MDNLNLGIETAKPASSINAVNHPLPIELENIINTIETFFKQCGAEAYMALKSGLSKNAHTSFKPSTFLANINLLLFNFLKETNKDKLPVLKAYFDGLNSNLKLLDSLNLKLAEKEFLANIIGYSINCYKNNTFKEHEKL